jgi:hypothetical protein
MCNPEVLQRLIVLAGGRGFSALTDTGCRVVEGAHDSGLFGHGPGVGLV